jgi:putative oxidoreductase
MAISSTTKTRGLWVLRVILALLFAGTGGAKLAAIPHMVQTFDIIDLDRWFLYVTGAVEVGGAILLLIPRTAFYAAFFLCAEMICAVAVHFIFPIEGTPVPAMVFVIMFGLIAYCLRPTELLGLKTRLI